MATLGSRIRTLRADNNLTQEEVGNKLGVARATLASWEINRRKPDNEALKQLASVFNCRLSPRPHRRSTRYFYTHRRPQRRSSHQNRCRPPGQPELLSFWQDLSQREDLQLMFKQVRDLSPETIRKVV